MNHSSHINPTRISSQAFNAAVSYEAMSFLKDRLKGIQPVQCHAIKMALEGNTEKLQSIRASRNVAPTLPCGVSTTNVAPGMKLFMRVEHKQRIENNDGSVDGLPLLVYFHGGGWTFGSINSCTQFCAAVAESRKALVLAVDYRLAPEHPFPAALDDCSHAFHYAMAHADAWGADAARVSLGGDSSGGNLAVAAALKCICDKKPLPSSLVLFYPVVKGCPDGSSSWKNYAEGFGLDAALMNLFFNAYAANDALASNPLISVADAPDEWLRQLPPIFLLAAGRDILHDQGINFSEHLRCLGVPLRYECIEGAVHLFITVDGQPTAFRYAVETTIECLEGGQ